MEPSSSLHTHFDQPDLKARWTLSLEVPEGWAALGNGAETQLMSTYLFAFAAGRFSIEHATRNGRPLRMFHRETDAAKVASLPPAIPIV